MRVLPRASGDRDSLVSAARHPSRRSQAASATPGNAAPSSHCKVDDGSRGCFARLRIGSGAAGTQALHRSANESKSSPLAGRKRGPITEA